MHQTMSWTGSESKRRMQGICRPPAAPANRTPRFLVPAGICGFCRRADETDWYPWTTTCENGFDRFEHIEDGCPVFRSGGYLLKVEGHAVIQRDKPRLDFSGPLVVIRNHGHYRPNTGRHPHIRRRRGR